eukprot:TRINITY_DN5094_c0_g1_i3.p1 TRINITY_DN5094_c0_g1~~TRINITY_DN5094_c0_g1_i3.p1  ORF type:complete len:254 (-),score=4.99 TRINITY_DN5094_c0_g1_i3:207-968(-)
MPSNLQKQQGDKLFKKLKEYLWDGKIDNIISLVKSNCKKIGKKLLTELTYFMKNERRMVYSKFRENKLLCGSGIVESAIRRIINLRFKCPSSFWDEKNLEGLIYLRAILLSKRWNIMIYNLNNNGYKYQLHPYKGYTSILSQIEKFSLEILIPLSDFFSSKNRNKLCIVCTFYSIQKNTRQYYSIYLKNTRQYYHINLKKYNPISSCIIENNNPIIIESISLTDYKKRNCVNEQILIFLQCAYRQRFLCNCKG